MVPVDAGARSGEGSGSGDEDLSNLALNALSLTETTTRTGNEESNSPTPEDEHPTQIGEDTPSSSSSSNTNTEPRDIPGNSASSSESGGMRRYELTPGPLVTENVMTPRNDVGPFVLDGGANRDSTGGGTRSLDAAANASAS